MNNNEQHVNIDMHYDQAGKPLQMRRILEYRDYLKGANDVLLLGAGPSGAKWRDHVGPNTYLMACNSAIIGALERADAFATVEATAVELPWYFTAEKITRFVSYKNIEYDQTCFDHGKDVVPVERSWHMAGFDPSEYVNPCRRKQKRDHAESSPYYKCHSFIGYDHATGIEYGLIKGPIAYPFNMSTGTILSAGLHLLCFMGVAKVRLLGFDLSWQDGPHFAEPGYVYEPSRWVPPECWVRIGGLETLWHFAMTAAWVKSMYPLFAEHGTTIENVGGGMLDVPGIETLLSKINDPPQDVRLECTSTKTA